jgi:hypothetical protein
MPQVVRGVQFGDLADGRALGDDGELFVVEDAPGERGSGEVCAAGVAAGWRWSAAKACVELVKECAQPAATRAANRHPPQQPSVSRYRLGDTAA